MNLLNKTKSKARKLKKHRKTVRDQAKQARQQSENLLQNIKNTILQELAQFNNVECDNGIIKLIEKDGRHIIYLDRSNKQMTNQNIIYIDANITSDGYQSDGYNFTSITVEVQIHSPDVEENPEPIINNSFNESIANLNQINSVLENLAEYLSPLFIDSVEEVD